MISIMLSWDLSALNILSAWLLVLEPGAWFDSRQLWFKDSTLPWKVGILVLFPGFIWKGTLLLTPAQDVRQIFDNKIPTFLPLGMYPFN